MGKQHFPSGSEFVLTTQIVIVTPLRVVCHYWKVSDADCLSLVTDRQLVSKELVSDRAAASMGNKETFRIHNILCMIIDLIKQTGFILTFRKGVY